MFHKLRRQKNEYVFTFVWDHIQTIQGTVLKIKQTIFPIVQHLDSLHHKILL